MREVALTASLERCAMFRGLPGSVLGEIAGFSGVRRLRKGAFLFRAGEPSVGMFVVQRGVITLKRTTPQGREQVIHVFRDGESFGEGTLAEGGCYPADAEAVEETQVVSVGRDDLVALLGRRPELAMRMLASMSGHLRELVGQIEDLKMKRVEERLAGWLVRRCPDAGAEGAVVLELETSKRVLAAEIGTVSETLSRTLAKMQRAGLLEVEGKRVTVTSPAEMARVAEGWERWVAESEEVTG